MLFSWIILTRVCFETLFLMTKINFVLTCLFALCLKFITLEAYLLPQESPVMKHVKPVEITHHESGMPYIDCIYLINLDRATDKWNAVSPTLMQLGLNVNRVSAIDGFLLKNDDIEEMHGPYTTYLRKGEIGCLLSHLSILKDAYERNLGLIWVMEDDVEFLEDLRVITESIQNLNQIDPSWDVLYTDTNSRRTLDVYNIPPRARHRPGQPTKERQHTQVGHNLEKIGARYGMYSIILSRSGIEKLYHYLSHVYLYCPIDHDIHIVPNISEYGITRDVVTNAIHNFASETKRAK